MSAPRRRTRIASITLAAVLAGLVVPLATTPESAAASPAVITEPDILESWVDDSDTAAWAYTGAWSHASDQWWSAENHDGTESFSHAAGARITVKFTGTEFELVGPKGPNAGRFRVTVDCQKQFGGNAYAPSKQFGASLFSLDKLPDGLHTVVVEVLGTRQAEASDSFVSIDGLRVWRPAPSPSSPGRWMGGADPASPGGAVTLRAPGCGASSSLVEQLKARVSGGWFGVPGAGSVWGAVGGHSQKAGGQVPAGPVVIDGTAYNAATIPVTQDALSLRLALPEKPRSLVLSVAADPTIGEPVLVAVVGAEGDVLPMRVLRGDGSSRRVSQTSQAVRVNSGEIATVIADLTDGDGVAAGSVASILGMSASGSPAQVDILEGHTAVATAERLSAMDPATPDASVPVASEAPVAAFRGGPVVLSRVLADRGVTAWEGDQNSALGGSPVPFTFGSTGAGLPLTVHGVRQPEDAIALELPASSGPVSSARLRLQVGQQCRAFTASVGLDDSTPGRESATASVAFFGDGEALPVQHNGVWEKPRDASTSEGFFSHTDTRDPVTMSGVRSDVAEQFAAAMGAMGAAAFHDDAASGKAFAALIAAQRDQLADTADDPAMSLMTYPLSGPVVLGVGANGRSPQKDFVVGDVDTPLGGDEAPVRTIAVTPVDLADAYPISVDLAAPRLMDQFRDQIRRAIIPLAQIQSPLARTVDIVVSGTPGARVVLSGAGLDCVSTEISSRVFPLWSQIGLRPPFLPTPTNGAGEVLDALGFSPLWWDTVCPAGPSTETGITFQAERVRTRVYDAFNGPGDVDGVAVTDVARSARPGCSLVPEQRHIDYGEFKPTANSPEPPTDSAYQLVRDDVVDPVAEHLHAIDGDLKSQAADWLKRSFRTTMEHPLEFAIWAALAPFDLPMALVMNPFVMNGLPLEVGLVAGLAAMPWEAAEGLEAGLAGAAVVSNASRPLESTNELLLVPAEVRSAEVADGSRLALRWKSQTLSFPAVTREGELVADLAPHPTSRAVVGTDRAVSRLPQVSDHAPWATDEYVEARQICPRRIEPVRCRINWFPDEGEWMEEIEEGEEGEEVPLAPQAPVELPAIPTFANRYPDLAAAVTTGGRSLETGEWSSAEAAQAWDDMIASAAEHLYEGAPEKLERLFWDGQPIAPVMRTSTGPTYVFSKVNPAVGLENGLYPAPNSWGENYTVDLFDSSRRNYAEEESAFVHGSSDPDVYTAITSTEEAEDGWYRYELYGDKVRGIDLYATLEEAGQTHIEQQVAARRDVLYPFVPKSAIKSVSLMDRIGGRYRVVARWAPEGADPAPLAEYERVGRPAPTTETYLDHFDGLRPVVGKEVGPFTVTRSGFPADAAADAVIVFSKHTNGWRVIPAEAGLTAEELHESGFLPARWEDGTREFWVPNDTDAYDVDVPEDLVDLE